jgi:hypothetical protein
MSLLVPNCGEVLALGLICNKTSQADLKLHLYKSNTTPAETDTVSTYTESTATGYSVKTLTGASWTITTDGGGVTTASYAAQTFTYTATETVYGYYVTNNAGTTLLFAEKFSDGPYNIPSGGGSVTVTLNWTAE